MLGKLLGPLGQSNKPMVMVMPWYTMLKWKTTEWS